MKTFGTALPGLTYVERPGAYAFLYSDDRARLAVIATANGLFLPGGGLDPGEEAEAGLARELMEETAWRLTSAHLLGQAAQYHWSEYYRSYFKKIGSFYEVEARAPAAPAVIDEHELRWLEPREAARLLTQEFQRWAVAEWA